MKLLRIYDGRDFGDFDDGKIQAVKFDLQDAKGLTYFGWKYLKGEVNHYGDNYRVFQGSLLSNGKKPRARKVSKKNTAEILRLVEEYLTKKNVLWGKMYFPNGESAWKDRNGESND